MKTSDSANRPKLEFRVDVLFDSQECQQSDTMQCSSEDSIASTQTSCQTLTRRNSSTWSGEQENTKRIHYEKELPKPEEFEVFLKSDLMADPSLLLHYHANHLLIESGWGIGTLKRSDSSMESVYRSPGRTVVCKFTKAWTLCGQNLLDGYELVEDTDGMEWNSIHSFSHNVITTLSDIDKGRGLSKTAFTLAQRWLCLDPFVVVGYSWKMINALRRGEIVKVTKNILVDKIDKTETPSCENHDGASGSAHLVPQSRFRGRPKALRSGAYALRSGAHALRSGAYGSYRTINSAGDILNADIFDTSSPTVCENVSDSIMSSGDLYDIHAESSCSDQNSQTNPTMIDGLNMYHPDQNVLYEVNLPDSCETLGVEVVECSSRVKVGERMNVEAPEVTTDDARFVKIPSCSNAPVETEKAPEPDIKKKKCSSGLLRLKCFGNCGKCVLLCASETLQLSEFSSLARFCHETRHPCRVTFVNKGIKCLDHCRERKYEAAETNAQSIDQDLVPENCEKVVKKGGPNALGTHQAGSGEAVRSRKITYEGERSKESCACEIDDDDLLVSAIIKNKGSRMHPNRSIPKPSSRLVRPTRKPMSQMGSGRLLPKCWISSGNVKKYQSTGKRTLLSWLIDMGTVAINDIIQCQNVNDVRSIKKGLVTRSGLHCMCCDQILSMTQFQIHAGNVSTSFCSDLYTDSGQPFILSLLLAWSSEYKSRKDDTKVRAVDQDDKNDDVCGLCVDEGELICCDGCPSAFHRTCLLVQDIPEGSWYCPNCICQICGISVSEDSSSSTSALKCLQCEQNYHMRCLEKQQEADAGGSSVFCSHACREIHRRLWSRVRVRTPIAADDTCWMLLKCISDERRLHSPDRLALKAECNAMLAVSLSLMEENFSSMLDLKTGIDVLTHLLYNWPSAFSRLNFTGFYTAVLERDDTVISAASIRVHGAAVAEMPLIATCRKYRRQGMCRRLFTAVQQMLEGLKVGMLVVASIPNLVDTWISRFGFRRLDESERITLISYNLMVFPGTIMLKKNLHPHSFHAH